MAEIGDPYLMEGIGDENFDVIVSEILQTTLPITTPNRGPPDREIFAGPYNFDLEINTKDINKKTYLYSVNLHRIYVDMKKNFVLNFNFDNNSRQMYVRATTVFSEKTEAQNRVQRCIQHAYDSVANQDSIVTYNVLHSASEHGTQGIYYCGDCNSPDVWYSILIAMAPCTSHAFRFVCKNSCPGGINRRPIDIIFTLEDSLGKVYGRQTVSARVCACPKRDLNHDEEALAKSSGVTGGEGNKRILGGNLSNPSNIISATKRVKIEVTDTTKPKLTLPPIHIPDKKIMIHALKVSLQLIEHEASRVSGNYEVDKYNECVKDFKNHIQLLEADNNIDT